MAAPNRPRAAATVTLRCHGHPHLSESHTTTTELKRNDDDLSPRARRVLEAVDLVLAEDTRRFRDLTRRTGLRVGGRVLSYHDHNEAARTGEVLGQMERGARVALVSDAGTPLCSDPGYVVVG